MLQPSNAHFKPVKLYKSLEETVGKKFSKGWNIFLLKLVSVLHLVSKMSNGQGGL